MTTGTEERQSVAQLAEEQDWQRRVSGDERGDIFNRGTVRILGGAACRGTGLAAQGQR